MAASPLVVPPRVIVCPVAATGPSVVAFDWQTGEPKWQNNDFSSSYASPTFARIAEVDQVLVHQQDALRV